MTRAEFLNLRNLQKKPLAADIVWQTVKGTKPNKTFKVFMGRFTDYEVWVHGRYNPVTTSVVYTFVVAGVGPICRLCVRGEVHKPAGRTHKHDLKGPEDPENNLPAPAPRPEFEQKSAREVWDVLCSQANIKHSGTFSDP